MKRILSYSIGILFLLSCRGEKGTPESPASKNIIITEAICIQNEAPLYEEPGGAGRIISYVQLGEVVQIITNKHISKEPEAGKYYKIHLPDSTGAWISASAIYTNVVPASIMEEADINTGPKADTITGRKFFLAEFVLITEENKEWVKLTGANKKKKGWVQKKFVSTDPGDVHVAILAQNYLLESDGKMIIDKLPDFIMQLPDKNTRLAAELQKIMDKEVSNAVEQSITDYEEQQIEGGVYEED